MGKRWRPPADFEAADQPPTRWLGAKLVSHRTGRWDDDRPPAVGARIVDSGLFFNARACTKELATEGIEPVVEGGSRKTTLRLGHGRPHLPLVGLRIVGLVGV